MVWINVTPYAAATGRLRKIYDRVKDASGQIDNILLAHSLRPHTLEGHLALYKQVMHNAANRLPAWFLEAVGVHVSRLNGCAYCIAHHEAGLRRALADDARWRALVANLRRHDLGSFSAKEAALLGYAGALTRAPADLTSDTIAGLREAGADDGEILEINQVASYFAYANRTVLGLGVSVEGEALGRSPSDTTDEDNWHHR